MFENSDESIVLSACPWYNYPMIVYCRNVEENDDR